MVFFCVTRSETSCETKIETISTYDSDIDADLEMEEVCAPWLRHTATTLVAQKNTVILQHNKRVEKSIAAIENYVRVEQKLLLYDLQKDKNMTDSVQQRIANIKGFIVSKLQNFTRNANITLN